MTGMDITLCRELNNDLDDSSNSHIFLNHRSFKRHSWHKETIMRNASVAYPTLFGRESSIRQQASLRGFTLVELLVVIAIIGVLVALLLPAVQQAREAARRMQCTNNLKQIGLALHNHHDTYNKFPAGHVWAIGTNGNDLAAESTWVLYLLPFLEMNNLYDLADLNQGFGHGTTNNNGDVITQSVPSMLCPSGPSDPGNWVTDYARGSYVGNNGLGPLVEQAIATSELRARQRRGVLSMNSKTRFADMVDGSTNTAFVSETIAVVGNDQRGVLFYPEGPFYHHDRTPNSAAPDELRNGTCVNDRNAPCIGTYTGHSDRSLLFSARSLHPGGVMVTMGDGSVQFATETIDLNIWRAASTPSALDDEVLFTGF